MTIPNARRNAIRPALFGAMALAVALFALDVTPSRAEVCARSGDQLALDARVLQTELMVGALTCNNQLLYNEFVRKYRHQLVEQGKSLQAFFRRQHGGAASAHLNDFVTRLANEASQRSMMQRVGFCRQSSLLFAEALNGEKPDLKGLIRMAAAQGVHGVRPCGSSSSETVAGYGRPSGKRTLDQQRLPAN